MLRQPTSDLADDGFSERVLQCLPVRRRNSGARSLVLVAFASASVCFAGAVVGPWHLATSMTALVVTRSFLAPASILGTAAIGLLAFFVTEALATDP